MWANVRTELLPSFISTFLLLLQLAQKPWAKTVYMDKYGDCFRGDVIPVENEKFTIKAQGGEAYDTLICEMTFESVNNDRLCVNFRSLAIKKCDVKLNVYSAESSHGSAIASYNCHTDDESPEPVCSQGKYITIRMRKRELSHEGYDFNLELREFTQSDAFAEGIDAYILSIGVIVGIIVGVIVVVILTSVVIVYCCCKRQPYGLVTARHSTSSKKSTSCRTGATEVPVEPSVIVVVILTSVVIVYCCCKRQPYGLVTARHSTSSKKSTSCRTGATEVPVEPSAPPLPVEDPPPYRENPPPYTSSSDIPPPTENCQLTDELVEGEKTKLQC